MKDLGFTRKSTFLIHQSVDNQRRPAASPQRTCVSNGYKKEISGRAFQDDVWLSLRVKTLPAPEPFLPFSFSTPLMDSPSPPPLFIPQPDGPVYQSTGFS
ncbi:hypothetical protein Baya_1120 [Bagarius yarrelli]|uniref:Uncharacterized protein n=1 Tax=Bagarius yarrelli TaxID=175774 RepID=A0A556TK80_BAGYA|nr:hypothetical protein Baya_1120 [Bagarius yarrelli]